MGPSQRRLTPHRSLRSLRLLRLLPALLLPVLSGALRIGLADQLAVDTESQRQHAAGGGRVVQVEKAKMDPREYSTFTLSNGLPVMCIRDKTSSQSSASLDIHVGSFYDPNQIPGVAHFLEHMLFLGSEKYPTEGLFDSKLAQHGGYSNAYTASENTNYFFAVSDGAFEECTDMFAQMFTSPLLSIDATNREANAINSEHEKNHNNDEWRIERVKMVLAKEGHPYNRFGTGNKDTLLKDVQQSHKALQQLFNGHYCVKNMHLTLLSSQPLEKTVELAKKSFANVRQQCTDEGDRTVGIGQAMASTTSGVFSPPYDQSVLASTVRVRTLANKKSLSLVWQIPPQNMLWKQKATAYVSSLLSSQHSGSLYNYLTRKDEALVEGVQAGQGESLSMFSTFEVEMPLTEAGTKKIDHIVEAVQAYLALIDTKEGIQNWRFDELKTNARMHFDYKEKEAPEDYTSSVASSMRLFPLEKVLVASSSFEEFNSTTISNLLKYISPKNMIIVNPSKHDGVKLGQTEQFYGVEYDVSPMSKERIAALEQIRSAQGSSAGKFHEDLFLPPKSSFVVTEAKVKEIDPLMAKFNGGSGDPAALVIHDDYASNKDGDRRVVAHWLQDTQFKKPKGTVTVSMYTAKPYETTKQKLTAELFAAMVSDALVVETDAATSAGYSCNIGSNGNGLDITVSGFSQHLPRFLEYSLQKMSSPEKLLKKSRFSAIKTSLAVSIENSLMAEPFRRIGSLLSNALETPHKDPWLTMKELEKVEFDDCVDFKRKNLADVAVEIFVFGNSDLKDARKIVKQATSKISSKVTTPSLLASLPPSDTVSVYKLQKGSKTVFRSPPSDESNPNSCVQTYWQYGRSNNRKDKLYLSVLNAIAHGPCYGTLRTDEQLGYVVASQADARSKVYGFKILVQSSIKPAGYLQQRILNFMDTKLDKIVANLTDSTFKEVVSTLVIRTKEPAQSSSSVQSRAFSEIASREYKYNRREEDVKELSKVTLEGFKAFYAKLRAGPMVSIQIDKKAPANAAELDSDEKPFAEEKDAELNQCEKMEIMPKKFSDWHQNKDTFDHLVPNKLPECKENLCSVSP